jgi:predicted O-methyltransferase YrrM
MELDERAISDLLQAEHAAIRTARERATAEGVPAVAPEVGALLRFLVRLTGARQAVEVGSGAGCSGLWLLEGLGPRGTLTTVEPDAERRALAQRAYADARATDRVRSMLGPAPVVLPRLADANYDLVFLDGPKDEYPALLDHARRLLRPGGLLVADDVLGGEQGPAALVRSLADDPAWTSLLLPLANGVLVASLAGQAR